MLRWIIMLSYGQSPLTQKDINDMVNDGIDVSDVISSNTHSGLTAKFLLNQWKNVRNKI